MYSHLVSPENEDNEGSEESKSKGRNRQKPRSKTHLISFLRLHMWPAPENEQPALASPETAEHKGRNREEREEKR